MEKPCEITLTYAGSKQLPQCIRWFYLKFPTFLLEKEDFPSTWAGQVESAELGPAETSLKEKEQVPGCLARQFLKLPLGFSCFLFPLVFHMVPIRSCHVSVLHCPSGFRRTRLRNHFISGVLTFITFYSNASVWSGNCYMMGKEQRKTGTLCNCERCQIEKNTEPQMKSQSVGSETMQSWISPLLTGQIDAQQSCDTHKYDMVDGLKLAHPPNRT